MLNDPIAVDVNVGRRDAVAWAEKNRKFAETGILGGDDDSIASKDYGKKD